MEKDFKTYKERCFHVFSSFSDSIDKLFSYGVQRRRWRSYWWERRRSNRRQQQYGWRDQAGLYCREQ